MQNFKSIYSKFNVALYSSASLLKPGFLKVLYFVCWYVSVCPPQGINKQWCNMEHV